MPIIITIIMSLWLS